MRSKFCFYLAILFFVYGCQNSQLTEEEKQEIEKYSVLPNKVNLSGNKSIEIKISECNFGVINPEKKTKYKSSSTDGLVKILLGSNLTCDFKNGAFIKELLNTSDTLKVEIYPKGTRLSNECKCYFYYEITLKNKSKFPEYIMVGNDVFNFDMQNPLTNSKLSVIENKLIN